MHPVVPLLLFALLSLTVAEDAAPATPPTPAAPDSPDRRLLFVAELCRHGDRTPLEHFPSDALPAPEWPLGVGQLTAVGERAHYELGARLRERYVATGFLPATYNRAQVHVRSTNIDRTLMSAQSQMTGLYPPGSATLDDVRTRFDAPPLADDQGGLPHRFQPVPVHTEAKATDVLLLPGNFCPRHDAIMDEKKRASAYTDLVRREAPFLKKAASIAGVDHEQLTLFELEKLHDTWRCFHAHNVPLPKEATASVVERARQLSDWLLTYGNQGREVQRLRAGLILYKVLRYMGAARLNSTDKLPEEFEEDANRFVLFSAHDTTVAATLSALRAFDNKNPPYNSTIIWELFEERNASLTVRVEYNGRALVLPGCTAEFCPIEEYIESTRDRTVHGKSVREAECTIGWRRSMAMASIWLSPKKNDPLVDALSPTDVHKQGATQIFAVLAGVVALVVAVIGICGIVRLRQRYKGYAPTEADPKFDEYSINHPTVSDQRILM